MASLSSLTTAVSISALAKQLGISISTVSRALNGYTDVSNATRLAVIEAARKAGYRPNPAARRLASGKTGCIGLVTTVLDDAMIDQVFAPLLAGLTDVLQPLGYYVIATGFPLGDDEMKLFGRFVEANFVDGLIVARTRPHDPRIELLREQNIPFVTYGRTQEAEQHAWLDSDSVLAFRRAAERLIQLGHHRIAMLNAPLDFNFAQLRLKGYEAALRKSQLPIDKQLVVSAAPNAESGRRTALKLLEADAPPTAFLCANDALALGAMAACKEKNLRVGHDVSIIGHGNTEAARFAQPPLTSIEQRIGENGRQLAHMLLRMLDGAAVTELQQLEEVNILARASDGPGPYANANINAANKINKTSKETTRTTPASSPPMKRRARRVS